ncbi:hypothetical protein [Streptacidiphilus fuscans]|uniref:Integral membrane protein n=1 Tax=Streptacidiphilus fuscans TaxID=2789292 RepID=A0A931AXK0_9ACTN|nr:hypothetical protein [Streptacidiphilus fuscans]MBF9067244.1 hypothetical protein [Streptacidiphilus fuscans]
MDGFGLRFSRAVVFAAVSVLLAVGSRLVVTGLPVPLDVIGMAFGLALGVAMILFARGERRYPAIIAVMVPVQVGLNALFNVGQQSCPPGPGNGVAVSGWGALACGGGSIRPSLLGLTEQAPRALVSLTGAGALLLLALHLVLALVAAWWLRRGEAAVFAVLRTVAVVSWSGVAALLAWLVTPVALPEGPTWVPPATGPVPSGPQDALLSAASRRGPPVLARAC